ncbi:unnamed protein product, partial [marine sediment metagenome]
MAKTYKLVPSKTFLKIKIFAIYIIITFPVPGKLFEMKLDGKISS